MVRVANLVGGCQRLQFSVPCNLSIYQLHDQSTGVATFRPADLVARAVYPVCTSNFWRGLADVQREDRGAGGGDGWARPPRQGRGQGRGRGGRHGRAPARPRHPAGPLSLEDGVAEPFPADLDGEGQPAPPEGPSDMESAHDEGDDRDSNMTSDGVGDDDSDSDHPVGGGQVPT